MPITTLSSREFNQDASGAKRAAKDGPVFITDRGRPSHVLLSIEEYRRITGQQQSIAELLSLPPGVADIDFDPPRLTGRLFLMYILDTNVVSELRKTWGGKADCGLDACPACAPAKAGTPNGNSGFCRSEFRLQAVRA